MNVDFSDFGRRLGGTLREQARPAIVIFAILVIVTGLIYPMIFTGVSQVAFDDKANGSLIYDDEGNIIGSELIGQYIDEEEYPDLFWGRISAGNYDANSSGGNNWGESNQNLTDMVKERVNQLKDRNTAAGVGGQNAVNIPSDLVTASSSGLDPNITLASAYYQVPAVLAYHNGLIDPESPLYDAETAESRLANYEHYRTLTESDLIAMIDAATQKDALGNEYVNVLKLNFYVSGYWDLDTSGATGTTPDTDNASSGTFAGMSSADWALYIAMIVVLAVGAILVTKFMYQVYEEKGRIGKFYSRAEGYVYKPAKIGGGMNWKVYLLAVLMFNLFGFILLFLILMFQDHLPMNPQGLPGMDPYVAFNTAVSFVTNTNWQAYSGEVLSNFSQMMGLTVQNFLSAATGIAVLVALIRGLRNRSVKDIGNFWRDVTKATAVLLPIAFIISLVLVSQGVPQTLDETKTADLVFPYTDVDDDGNEYVVDTQTIRLGTVASQESIKELGTNGGGFYNANSSQPYENPNAITNIAEMSAILVIPISCCFFFGMMIHDRRQGWAVFAVMAIIFIAFFAVCASSELAGNRGVAAANDGVEEGLVSQEYTEYQLGGNMEGKEVRFGAVGSSMFAVVTTSSSCGAVNSMHDSYTSIGGMCPMLLMMLGEVCFGGVGCGLYGMLMFVIIAVFIAGLMVGRMPEYLGKKIGPTEMKIASAAVIVPVLFIIGFSALAVVWPGALDSLNNPGAHGFSEILYAFASGTGNNGSAFAGLNASTPFYCITVGLAMLGGRFIMIILTLALAGSMAEKKSVPPSAGTLPTHTPTFVLWLLAVVVLVGILSFFLCLSLGPFAEALM